MSDILDDLLTKDNHLPQKQHGCLTIFLFFMLALNLLALASYLIVKEAITGYYPEISDSQILVLALSHLFSFGCIISLFYKKKYGFYGLLLSATFNFGINLYLGTPFINALYSFLWLGVLYLLLQLKIKGNIKGWDLLN